MSLQSEKQKVAVSNKIMMIITLIMALVYFGFGSWLVISERSLFNISVKNQKILGIMFIVYSLYRGYIFYTRYIKKRNYDRNEFYDKS